MLCSSWDNRQNLALKSSFSKNDLYEAIMFGFLFLWDMMPLLDRSSNLSPFSFSKSTRFSFGIFLVCKIFKWKTKNCIFFLMQLFKIVHSFKYILAKQRVGWFTPRQARCIQYNWIPYITAYKWTVRFKTSKPTTVFKVSSSICIHKPKKVPLLPSIFCINLQSSARSCIS